MPSLQTPQALIKVPNMDKIKVGIIGIGNVGASHAQCIYDNNVVGMELAAVCDIDTSLLPIAKERFPGVAFFEDFREMLQEDIDLVIVSVPHPLHADIATQCFQQGKHVLVEKPIDIRVSKARMLHDVAQKSGKVFGVMFNQRTGNLFQKAKEIVQSGALGFLKRSTWIITNWYRTQHYYDSGSWRATWSGEGGGVLVNQAPHQLDLWQWICGMPESITAYCEVGKYHNIEVEDTATIFAKFPCGAEGTFITSTAEYPGTNRLEIVGSLGKLVLENGLLRWWKLATDEYEFSKTCEESFPKIPYTYEEFQQEAHINGHQRILQNLSDHIVKGAPLIASGYEAIRALSIQNAAYLSAWKGNTEIRLPMDEQEFDHLLSLRQNTVLGNTKRKDLPNTQYDARWQINW